MSDEERLIGTTEAAGILGVNRATVIRWADKGLIPQVRKLPGKNGARLFDSKAIRRKATERLLDRAS